MTILKLKKMKKNSALLMLLALAAILLFLFNYKKVEAQPSPEKEKAVIKVVDVKINKVNFYFENSLSMNGYLGGKDFKQTMHRIIDDKNPNFTPFFVNTAQYDAKNILSKIDNKNIITPGTNNSDHQFIFTNAIKNAVNNNLGIVVTDGIYSTLTGDIDIVEIEIEKAFTNALKSNAIETVVLKMSSKYNGTYYTVSPNCGNVTINQERPYYILLFGTKGVIDKALKDIVKVEDLGGYINQARFFLTKAMKVDYSVLLNGDEKKGHFKPTESTSKMIAIGEVEKYTPNEKGVKDAYLQFAIAVDFSSVSIPEEYLVNPDNYNIDENTDYEIIGIKKTDAISAKTKQDVNSRLKNATHIIIVKGQSKLFGDLNIHLNINTPSWIDKTGVENDCDIKKQTNTTIAFDKLMKGISGAYEKTNDKKEYFNLIIKTKP
jgi:hypothetical protein